MTAHRIQLRCLGPEQEGYLWESETRLRIGRLAGLEMAFTDESVSREHAELTYMEEGWVVCDLGSTNGTFLNGIRVGRAGLRIRGGDVLQCGNILFQVRKDMDSKSSGVRLAAAGMRAEATVRQAWEDVLRFVETYEGTGSASPLLALCRVGRDCHHVGSLQSFLDSVLWDVAEVLSAEHGCFLLRAATANQLAVRSVFSCGRPHDWALWTQHNLILRALESGESLLTRRAQGMGHDAAPMSVLLALLRTPRAPLGVLCLGRGKSAPPFGPDDLRLADGLALAVSGTIENLELAQQNEQNLDIQLLATLTQMVELRRGSLGDQSRRVTEYALMLAEELRLPAEVCSHIRSAAPLLGLTKLGVSDAILQKAGPLSPDEFAQVRSAAQSGANLLETMPRLASLLPIIRNHHERWDGTGYPDGLAGEQIPLPARIVALANAFDAMTLERPYASQLSPEAALEEIQRGSGTQFDPTCVAAFQRLGPRISALLSERGQVPDTVTRAELERIKQELKAKGLLDARQARPDRTAVPLQT